MLHQPSPVFMEAKRPGGEAKAWKHQEPTAVSTTVLDSGSGQGSLQVEGIKSGWRGWRDLGNLPGGGGNKAHLLCTRDMGEGQFLQVNQGGQAAGTAGKGVDKTTGLERQGNFPVVSEGSHAEGHLRRPCPLAILARWETWPSKDL